MQKWFLTFLTLVLVGFGFFTAPARADLDDEEGYVTVSGIVREVNFSANECTSIPDSINYLYYLETTRGEKLCLTPEANSGIESFKYYLNKAVRVEGDRCCGFDKITVHQIVLAN